MPFLMSSHTLDDLGGEYLRLNIDKINLFCYTETSCNVKWDDVIFHLPCNFISRKTSCLILWVTLSLLVCPSIVPAEQIISTGSTSVYFSPNGGATEAIVKEINSAKSEILVQAYSFTSRPIAKALVETHKRGIKIAALLDRSYRKDKFSYDSVKGNLGNVGKFRSKFK